MLLLLLLLLNFRYFTLMLEMDFIFYLLFVQKLKETKFYFPPFKILKHSVCNLIWLDSSMKTLKNYLETVALFIKPFWMLKLHRKSLTKNVINVARWQTLQIEILWNINELRTIVKELKSTTTKPKSNCMPKKMSPKELNPT